MRRLIAVLAVAGLVVLGGSADAQVRGKGRLQGQVLEQGSGKPVSGATVTIAPASGSTTPIVTKTNDKGRWSALGLTNGQWHVDIEAAGYTTSRGTANVSEVQMLPPIKTELAPAAPEETSVSVASSVPQEIVDAVNLGQDLMAQEKYKEAILEFEKALPHLPDNVQLKQVLSQAYYKTGELKKAITMLELVTAADASTSGAALLLTNLYLEDGRLDEARALLQTVPAEAISDPTVYINIGILFMNKENPAEGVAFFTKAVEMDASRPESYYYRGVANLQLKKMAEAKADFTKVIELAPDSSEGRDAKQLLVGLK